MQTSVEPSLASRRFGDSFANHLSLTDASGRRAIADRRRVAVLAVDPSSDVTGGSILGDKTRMAALAASDDGFVRPCPSGGALGGMARSTRDAVLVCEAAGYDVILIETVGVGQSEHAVVGVADVLVVVLLEEATSCNG